MAGKWPHQPTQSSPEPQSSKKKSGGTGAGKFPYKSPSSSAQAFKSTKAK